MYDVHWHGSWPCDNPTCETAQPPTEPVAPALIPLSHTDGYKPGRDALSTGMADMNDLIEYIKEGNEQAVRASQQDGTESLDGRRWAGKSHAYLDVLAFIENEMES